MVAHRRMVKYTRRVRLAWWHDTLRPLLTSCGRRTVAVACPCPWFSQFCDTCVPVLPICANVACVRRKKHCQIKRAGRGMVPASAQPIALVRTRRRKPMFAQSVASALLSTEAMNYGMVIAGALVLICDIWLLLLHEPRPHP